VAKLPELVRERGAMGAPNHYLRWMDRLDAPRGKLTRRLGTIALVVVLLGLLAASILFAIRSWTSLEGPPMPEVGYVAMAMGVLFSIRAVTAMTRGRRANLGAMTTASRNSRGAKHASPQATLSVLC